MMSSLSPACRIPPPGEEATIEILKGPSIPTRLQLRHGSSLSLMSKCCEFMANSDDDDGFAYIDPTADHGKWARKGMSLYYAAVFSAETGSVLCALRAATRGLGDSSHSDNSDCSVINGGPAAKPRKRLLIDYVYTDVPSRGRGIAHILVNFVLETASKFGANAYVLSLEDSAVYWMERHGFLLCEDSALNERLNVFPDTHLLRRGSDPADCEEPDAANGASDSAVPPDEFTSALHKLLLADSTPRSDAFTLCLSSLATLIKNAVAEEVDGRRRRIKVGNPVVKERVFRVGGDDAMAILVACGFELGVDDEENTIMTFHDNKAPWLSAAIELLEDEAKHV